MASLPLEVKWYMTGAVREHGQRFDMTGAVREHGQRFGWKEFVDRVAERANADPSDAAFQARVVVDLVHEEVPESDFRQLREMLPEAEDDENWRELFEVVDAGGWTEEMEAQTGGGPQ